MGVKIGKGMREVMGAAGESGPNSYNHKLLEAIWCCVENARLPTKALNSCESKGYSYEWTGISEGNCDARRQRRLRPVGLAGKRE